MENLIIKQKLEDAIQYAYCAFRRFPKSERFVLVADLKRSLIRMLEMVIRANKSRDKLTVLYNIDVELEVFRSLIRLSMDLKFLPLKQYEILSNKMAEFGRLLGGWIRQSREYRQRQG